MIAPPSTQPENRYCVPLAPACVAVVPIEWLIPATHWKLCGETYGALSTVIAKLIAAPVADVISMYCGAGESPPETVV